MSAYCDLNLEKYDVRIQEIFSKAAFDAVLEANMHNMKTYISPENKGKLQRLISRKFEKEWPQDADSHPEVIVQHILQSSIFSQCIDFGCKYLVVLFYLPPGIENSAEGIELVSIPRRRRHPA